MQRRSFLHYLWIYFLVATGCRKKDNDENTIIKSNEFELLFPSSNDFFIAGCLNPISIENKSKNELNVSLKHEGKTLSTVKIVENTYIDAPLLKNVQEIELVIDNKSFKIKLNTYNGMPIALSEHENKLQQGELLAFINTENYPFFLKKVKEKYIAVSLVCTHNGCTADVSSNTKIICPCHGSEFNENGIVTNGPAMDNLPEFETTLFEKNNIVVVYNI
ncbi:MAG: ubiquinol-cytochrome c reductase iron-sulfur subunit [Bacteroidia bacterium]